MKKIFAFLISAALVFLPCFALAQDNGNDNASEGRVSRLQEGEQAPYGGILFDIEGYLHMQEQHRLELLEKDLKIDKQEELSKLKLEFKEEAWQDKYEAIKENKNQQIEIRDKQIEQAQAQNKNQRKKLIIVGTTSAVGGILLTVGMFYLTSEVAKNVSR